MGHKLGIPIRQIDLVYSHVLDDIGKTKEVLTGIVYNYETLHLTL